MSFIIDFLAVASLVGIWPRFVEPRRLTLTHLTWELTREEQHLAGLKIAHLTDLHFHEKTSTSFLEKIIHAVHQQKPDLILFTGDFLCYARLEAAAKLTAFLRALHAPLGSFCSLGNHDYAHYVSLNFEGVYSRLPPPNPLMGLFSGMKALFCSPKEQEMKFSPEVLSIPVHEPLCQLLSTTPFKLLENSTEVLPIGLNLTGLGDISLGRCLPQQAFHDFDSGLPGIVLSHNPDSIPSLLSYPGKWILSGHTHGEQIHLPWPAWGRKLSRKLARLKNDAYTRGLYKLGSKRVYVNRGLGCHKPFRLFSPPEICMIHLRSS